MSNKVKVTIWGFYS